MFHPHTTQQVNLGQCLLRASNSRLQLQFTANAHFSQPFSQSGHRAIKISQWQDLSSVWVTEGPELDIHLFIKIARGLEPAISALVADLGLKLCSSSIWSELGFVAMLKDSHTARDVDSPGPHLILGLCREHKASTGRKGRVLPAILQNPPNSHPPPDVPAITLASIDIHLEYNYLPQLEERFCDLMGYDLDSVMNLDQWHYRTKTESFAVATLAVSAKEQGPAYLNHAPNDVDASVPGHRKNEIQDTTSSAQILLQLLDSGLQRLIFSARGRRAQNRTVGKNTIQNLSRLLPAVFNPGYREAMSQRAASIPIISRALTSLLENTSNPFIQDKVQELQALHAKDSHQATESSPSSQNTSKSAVHSALWRIAQNRILRPNAIKRGTSFFASNPEPEPAPTQQITNSEIQLPGFLTEEEFEDFEFLDVDQLDGTSHEPRTEFSSQPITTLGDSVMEFMCMDSSASTQITMDDDLIMYESAQTTLDEFAFASTCDPIPFDSGDTEMLF